MTPKQTDTHINQSVEAGRGKSGGWPKCLTYTLTEGAARVALTGNVNSSHLRTLDSWGVAFFSHCRAYAAKPPAALTLEIDRPPNRAQRPYIEALHRRISYLNLDPGWRIALEIDGRHKEPYSLKELTERPPSEIIRPEYAQRGDDDKAGRLEKDFQAYLFGKGKFTPSPTEYGPGQKEENPDGDIVRTNERLAILGQDFRNLNRLKVPFRMEREFPTGAFDQEVSEETRILPTNYIDVLSFNKFQELALIELKVNDPKLQVISQSLDYALFFLSYGEQLMDVLEDKLGRRPDSEKFVLYIANNCFHEKFDTVAGYYSPTGKQVPFKVRKVVLGGTMAI